MKKFNIIIPKRNRDKYFDICLHYLNKASENSNSDVHVYVVSDTDCTDYGMYNIQLLYNTQWTYLNLILLPAPYRKEFCRGTFLNEGLLSMRKDFDFVSIIDCDMIYQKYFFRIIEGIVKDNTYFMSGGIRLTKNATERGMASLEYFNHILPRDVEAESIKLNSKKWYPSQITLTKKLYLKLIGILGKDVLYPEEFIGWGGEDSTLSFFSTECAKQGILKKVYSYDIWYHLWHKDPRKEKDFSKEHYDNNVKLLYKLHDENKIKLKNYLMKEVNE